MNIDSFRADRLGTLYLSHPLHRIFNKESKFVVPVLMYHSISSIPDKVSHPYFQTNTDPATFHRQMEWLAKNGYRAIPLAKIEEEQKRTNLDHRKPFVITFDDGFRDILENALPVLKNFRFTATVFLPTGYVGKRLMEKECLSWAEVRSLKVEGIEFGSHTVTHPKLHYLSAATLLQEVGNSKKIIEDSTGEKVNTFSYPYAFPQEDPSFISVIKTILSEQGYTHGVTTRIGRACPNDDLLLLKRIPMNMYDDSRMLRAKMEGCYDWLYFPQYMRRTLKKWF